MKKHGLKYREISLTDYYKMSHHDTRCSIGHCANCHKTMGAGVALAIRRQFPEAYAADINGDSIFKKPEDRLGNYTVCTIAQTNPNIALSIYNIYGQYDYSSSVRNLNYEALYAGMQKVKDSLEDNELIGFPYLLGCGLAGGSWTVVEPMIFDIFENQAEICFLPGTKITTAMIKFSL